MFCPNCGNKLPDGAAFCGSCGTSLAKKADDADSTNDYPDQTLNMDSVKDNSNGQVSFSVNQNPNENTNLQNDNGANSQKGNTYKSNAASQASPKKSISSKTKKIIIASSIAGAIVLIAIIVAVLVVTRFSDEGNAKATLEASEIAEKGVISNDYVKSDRYSFSDFNVTDIKNSGNTKDVYFTCEIENKNFHSSIAGSVNLSSKKVSINDKKTEPLKGVDFLFKSEDEAKELEAGKEDHSNTGSSSSNYSRNNNNYYDYSSNSNASKIRQMKYISNVNSVLEGNNPNFTCKATADQVLETWFVKDACKLNQSFSFDPNNGWSKKGPESLSDKTSTYTIEGIEFANDVGSNYDGNHTIKFGACKNDGTLSATYSIHYKPDQKSTEYTTYSEVNLSGTATGKLSHSFGELTFTFELTDKSKSVVLSGNNTSYTSSTSNTDYVNGLNVDIKTDAVYCKSNSSSSSYSGSKFSRTGIKFKQKNS